jgi:hypothetical protein
MAAQRRFALEVPDESTRAGARRHETPFPEREARRIEGGGARDEHAQGLSAAAAGYAAGGLGPRPRHEIANGSREHLRTTRRVEGLALDPAAYPA